MELKTFFFYFQFSIKLLITEPLDHTVSLDVMILWRFINQISYWKWNRLIWTMNSRVRLPSIIVNIKQTHICLFGNTFSDIASSVPLHLFVMADLCMHSINYNRMNRRTRNISQSPKRKRKRKKEKKYIVSVNFCLFLEIWFTMITLKVAQENTRTWWTGWLIYFD